MDLNDFLKNFADQFDDTDPTLIRPETRFRDIDEWSSYRIGGLEHDR